MASILLCVVTAAGQNLWNRTHLEQVKNSLDRPFYNSALKALIADADSLLNVAPLSVMMKSKTPASGNKHHYMSQARYFWPDPTKPDGLPYINRDGLSNPEIRQLDREALGLTADRITTLALAYYFTDDERYAAKATQLIRTWFLDKDTRMLPDMEYAQMIPGHNGGKGRCYGILDGYSFVEMLDGIALLEGSKSFTSKDSRELKKWFGQLCRWIINSPQGKEEAAQANNHSVAYDAQLLAFLLYAGDTKEAEKIITDMADRRIYPQINPDGSQPHELSRTLAYGYSEYNVAHFLDILQMARKAGMSHLIPAEAQERIFTALDFLTPYLSEKAPAWPYSQIHSFDHKKLEVAADALRALRLLPESDSRYHEYGTLYNDTRVWNPAERLNLLYVSPREIDDVMAFAIPQLRYAVNRTEAEKRKENNAVKRHVQPFSLRPDGSLNLVHPHHWCSGFFPGTLWMVYDFTNDPSWREEALSQTWTIEEAKWHKGTHDLGFMMYDSFGRGYDLTGEQSLRDVVVRSARTLATRYNPVVKSIRSWDHNADQWKFPVIIDNMMNLELLFRATQLTGDSTFYKIAVDHANTTLANHFRPDASSWHVVDYDPADGSVRMKVTHQGYSDDSFWSRGQAWGLYGFAKCYEYTGDRRYLDHSRRIADFFLSLPNMPADLIPYWDMKAPGVENLRPGEQTDTVVRDASSAAILASGLLLLADCIESADRTDNAIDQLPYSASTETATRKYRDYAARILNNLTTGYQVTPGTKEGFLLDHSTGHHPGGTEIDVPLNYADYYYLEALLRLSNLSER